VSKALLGKALFWDEQLSSTRTVACATCHIPVEGGSDPRSGSPGSVHPGLDGSFGTPDDVFGSPGVPLNEPDGSYSLSAAFGLRPQVTARKTPTMINAAYSPTAMFWDGRADQSFEDPVNGAVLLPFAAALESQVAGPPISDTEMGHIGADWPGVVARILAQNLPAPLANFVQGRDYAALFNDAFGSPAITAARVCMAIATYERTLIAVDAPFDAFIGPQGNPNALTPQEAQGFQIFTGPGRCVTCHGGALFTDNQFHYTGVRPVNEDLGRFDVDGLPQNRGAMKTPTLRNVELRAPYFHNGRFASLEAVVDFYNRGGDFDAPNKAPQITPLGLNPGQRAALVAFLRRPLTDTRVRDGVAPFDGPLLYSQSSFVPSQYGAPTVGSGGIAPELVALEPPKIGNPSLTVGLEHGRGGQPALFAVDLTPDFGGSVLYGTTMHIGLTSSLKLYRVAALGGAGAGNGFGSVSLNVPDDAALIGSSLYGQFFVLDQGGGPGRFAATRGVRFDWF
jgi:cytochrome c peroxidase